MKMLCHDPRYSHDRDVMVETENPALQAAELARQAFPDREVDWEYVARQADYCEQPVTSPAWGDYRRLRSLGYSLDN